MIICVPDGSGNPEYDLFFAVDTSRFTDTTAIEAVTRAVTDTQAANPDAYTFDDLLTRLPEGITPAQVVTVSTPW